MWDAAQYLRYADERARPFADLLGRVALENPRRIADLGCGPGNLTRILAERWPAAHVVGVDNSADMLAQARPNGIDSRLGFTQADLTAWSPAAPLDLIVSNAALQWVDRHETLITRLVGMLAPGGVLAVQMPFHLDNPAHLAIEAAKADPRWRGVLAGVGLHQQSVMPLPWYVERLLDLGLSVDAWQTTYFHMLSGADPVLEWFKGSALRPLLARLEGLAQREFLDDVGARLRAAYPPHNSVTVLPFPRIFFVAVAPEHK
jgi:trans-aconitate 2-methyltransferase